MNFSSFYRYSMQVLKQRVKERIMKAALKELAAYGFEKTSMSRIAKEAKVAVGNIYHYFKSKLDLFYAITSPVIERITGVIKHSHWPDFEQKDLVFDFMHNINVVMTRIVKQHRDEFLVLMHGSQGTKYEHTKERLVELLEKKILVAFRRQYQKDRVRIREPFIVHIFATNIIEGYSQIIEHYKNDEWLENISSDFVKHNVTGYFAFFKNAVPTID